jgi:hypothetical protein
MKHDRSVLTLALLAATICWVSAARAQGTHVTASRPLQLSAFGGVAGVYTGLGGGKNFSIVAGGDIGLPPWRTMRPTIEVRGLYPTDHGLVDSQKSILAGLKLEFLLRHRLRPYGDFLAGRGETNYGFGYIFGNNVYALTTTNVFSPGGGFDYDLSEHFSVRVDGQFQRWGEAPTPSGVIYSKIGTAALVYRFTFDRRGR